MPGLIAVFSKSGEAKEHSLAYLSSIGHHLHGGTIQQLPSGPNDRLSVAAHLLPWDDTGHHKSPHLSLWWYGNPSRRGQALSSLSSDRFPQDVDSLADWAKDVRGHFQFIFADAKRGQVGILTDCVSSWPFYFLSFDDRVIVTPEILSLNGLRQHGWNPEIRASSVYEFVATSHLHIRGTFYKDVQKASPSQMIGWSQEGALSTKNYFRFPGNDRIASTSRRGMQQELSEAIDRDIHLLPEGRAGLFTSGGYDSKCLLGLMQGRTLFV